MENVQVTFYPMNRTPKVNFLTQGAKLPVKYKLPKPTKHGNINRKQLMKLVSAGVMEARCDYRYTDDYAFDNAYGFGKTDWIPARLESRHGDRIEGQMNFKQWDFESRSGSAWYDTKDASLIHLSIHSNCSYTLRLKAGV